MDDMAGPIQKALGDGMERYYSALMVRFAKGLDEVHPFSDTISVDVLLREAESMISLKMGAVGPKNAGRIWGFLSKFVMLDRFGKTLGVAEIYPGIPLPRSVCSPEYLGTAGKILDDLNPPTKILGKFMKTWGDREKNKSQYFETVQSHSSATGLNSADITMNLSRRLVTVVKVRDIVNIEAGLEMIALAMIISSENDGVFPELAVDVKNVLRRIWSNRMDLQQLEDLSDAVQALHKSMKNLIEIVFAISPLLAISTNRWGTSSKSINSIFLLRIFQLLGNNRPAILVQLEDCVLKAVIGISEGKSREDVMDNLHSQIFSLQNDLIEDNAALMWFNIISRPIADSSSPMPLSFPSVPLTDCPTFVKEKFQGGLASPPASHSNSPIVSMESTTPQHFRNVSPSPFVNPKDLHDDIDYSEDEKEPGNLVNFPGQAERVDGVEPERSDVDNLAEGGVGRLSGDEIYSMTRSRVSSLSSRTAISDHGENDPEIIVRFQKASLDPPVDEENGANTTYLAFEGPLTPQGNDEDDPMSFLKSPSSDGLSDKEAGQGNSNETTESGLVEDVEDQVMNDVRNAVVLAVSPSGLGGVQEHRTMDIAANAVVMPVSSSGLLEDIEGEAMDGVESKEQSSDLKDVDEGRAAKNKVKSKKRSLDSSEHLEGDPDFRMESTQKPLGEEARVVALGEPFELRRSSRNAAAKNRPITEMLRSPYRGKKKPVVKKAETRYEVDGFDGMPKLSKVEKAKYHQTLYADIAGWGSTVDAGPKQYRHIPVEVVPPGNVASTGEDTETLRRVEALIQSEFTNGLPPHLQKNAKSQTYVHGSNQSRIFVASHSDFNRMDEREVQGILRERLILVHGNPLDYDYKWDLKSIGRLYDVDKKTTVHGSVSSLFDPHNVQTRYHQGTLRDFHNVTTTLSNDECPPLNAISLPVYQRNLFIPCQFGSVASHEVAQSRVPSHYESTFEVPNAKSQMEWCLIGGRGAISPFHVDPDGLGTVIVVLEGSKYWILATRLGEHDQICSTDAFGPNWNPYVINEEDNAERFRFEGVHLQKGDMLIMPGGVPHWVLGTSNAICVGRHFYSSSTIRSSVIATAQSFLLGGALTNEDLVETRTLLYQLLVFWSLRLDKTDVDGAHIPDISSEVGFLDVLYLGVFVILSPAFDRRFYNGINTSKLVEEVANAKGHFHSILRKFSGRFILFLEGEAVAYTYVLDRMVAEFAAASVNFSRGIDVTGQGEDNISHSMFEGRIEDILQNSRPESFPYYSRCLLDCHKYFVWTGPQIKILARLEDNASAIPHACLGEALDLPHQQIYPIAIDPATPPGLPPPSGKRRERADSLHPEELRKKQKRWP